MDEKLSDIWIRYCLSKYSEAFKFHSYFSDYFIVRFFFFCTFLLLRELMGFIPHCCWLSEKACFLSNVFYQ